MERPVSLVTRGAGREVRPTVVKAEVISFLRVDAIVFANGRCRCVLFLIRWCTRRDRTM